MGMALANSVGAPIPFLFGGGVDVLRALFDLLRNHQVKSHL
jgi:hypothetical protein